MTIDGSGSSGGRVVPVYALTGGRTRSNGAQLPMEALVTVTDLAARSLDHLQPEHRRIIELSSRSVGAVSLMEVGADLGVPVGVARVLVNDLANAGYLEVHLPEVAKDGSPSRHVLERLLNGLRTR